MMFELSTPSNKNNGTIDDYLFLLQNQIYQDLREEQPFFLSWEKKATLKKIAWRKATQQIDYALSSNGVEIISGKGSDYLQTCSDNQEIMQDTLEKAIVSVNKIFSRYGINARLFSEVERFYHSNTKQLQSGSANNPQTPEYASSQFDISNKL